MASRALLIAVALLATSAWCSDARAAESRITLKDGTVIKGEILSNNWKVVKVKIGFGVITYDYGEVESIETIDQEERASDAEAEAAADMRDKIRMKNGDLLVGLIHSEAGDTIEFDVIVSGNAVSRTMLARTQVSKRDVDEMKRLTDDERRKVRQYLESVQEQDKRDARAETDLKISKKQWDLEKTGDTIAVLEVELDHFVIASDTDEEFFKKAAFRLSKVFAAYKRHFGVDRNETQKVKVLIFNNMEEYHDFIGGAFKNTAFYTPDFKMIVAGCDLEKYRKQLAAIKLFHAEINAEIKERRAELDEMRAEVRGIVDEWYNKLHNAGQTTPLGRRIMAEIRRAQTTWEIKAMKYEKPIKDLQQKIRWLDKKNELVFDEFTNDMFKTLYHEGFHAFLDQFLFDEEFVKHVPRWLNEGLAQYFENARVEGRRLVLGQEDRPKIAHLRRAMARGEIVPFERMLNADASDYMSQDITNLENAALHYHQAWCLVHMLGQEGRLKKDVIRVFVKGLAKGLRPLQALPLLTGVENDELLQKWEGRLGTSINY